MTMKCQACAADLGKPEQIGRRDTCPSCGADLHSCANCRFYDRGSYNDCREPNAERVLDKKGSNFCEYFSPAGATPRSVPAKTGSARGELEKLFGGGKRKG